MSEPSKEAMEAAEDVLRTMQESHGLEYADPIDEIELGLLASAIDAHTADLRCEVEALRARVALLEGWNVGTEPPPPFVGSGSDDCEILIHASGFYRHPTESYEYNEWVKHGGDIVDVAFWRYTKAAQERLSDPEKALSEFRKKPESEW